MRPRKALIVLCLLLLVAGGCNPGPKPALELFVVKPAEGRSISYGHSIVDLSDPADDPDTVARKLLGPACRPAILHSTSWRWEKSGRLVLTYLAFSEDPNCPKEQPFRLAWDELLPPRFTDPEKPRPAEIGERDVLAHGIRHLTFLMRFSQDNRIREAVSPQALGFFQSMCAQLAGRFETARQFAVCGESSGAGAR